MRNLVAAVFVVVSLLLAAIAGPAVWVQNNVVSQDGFVELAKPLGTDPSFQGKIAAVAGTAATKELNIPAPFEELVQALVSKTVASLQNDPKFGQAWTETIKNSHKLTFDASAKDGKNSRVVVDATPIAALLVSKVDGFPGLKIPVPKDTIVSFDQPKVATILPVLSTVGGAGIWLAIGAVVLLILALVTAKRRGGVMLAYGLGLALVGAGWFFSAQYAQNQIPSMVGTDETAISFSRDLAQIASESWQGWVNGCLIAAGILVVVGVVALMVGRRPTT